MTNLQPQTPELHRQILPKTSGSLRARVIRATLSDEFVNRLVRFCSMRADWDGQGALAIPPLALSRAHQLATTALIYGAPEPFVAPASDGTVLLKWNVRNGSVEYFVEAQEGPGVIVTDFEDAVRELPVNDDAQALAVLTAAL